MKIGVYLQDIDITTGGGYSFQDDILHSLLKVETKHTIIILNNSYYDKNSYPLPNNIKFYSLERSIFRQRIDKYRGVLNDVVKHIPVLRRKANYTNWFQRIINTLRINMLWFPTPHYILTDLPYIITVWDLQFRLQPWFPEVSANGLWESYEKKYRIALPRATAIITGVQAGREEIVRFYGVPKERVRLIPHPTPGFALNPSAGRNINVHDKYAIPRKYLIYPAQFWPHKNHIGLLRTLIILQEKYNLPFPIVFVGSDKGNMHYVKNTAKELGISDDVFFIGFVPQEDLVALYRSAFALAYMTYFGPENLPPLEAFALGCPVIAANVPGALEQLGDAALLVNPSDEWEIASAINSIATNEKLRNTLIERGFKRARSFTGDDFVKSVFDIFDEFEPIVSCWKNEDFIY